jgi:glucan phosphoethanolaminetransferase (alkaline phosphatase superfamily)
MFITDWPLMFALGVFMATVAISRGRNKLWFSLGLVLSIASIVFVIYLYAIMPDFVMTGLGLRTETTSTGLLFVFYSWYVVAYVFGYTVGYFPLNKRISEIISKVKSRRAKA